MDGFLQITPETVREYAVRVLQAVLILAVGWWVVRFLIDPLRRLLERSRVDPSAASFLANSARAGLLVVVFLLALQHLGVQTASLITLLGAAGLALALSLQNSLSNFAAGLMILSFRLVRVGDQIEIGDIRGRVAELLPFHVILVSADNQRIIIPNNLLTTGAIKNNSTLTTRRVQWTLPLTSDADLPAAKEALRARLAADTRILPDPAPAIYVQDWSADKRTLVVQAWTNTADYLTVQQSLLEELAQAVQAVRRQGG